MAYRSLLLLVTLGAAACSSPEQMAEKTGAEMNQRTAAASASTAVGRAVKLAEDTTLYTYEFSYPAAVGAIPALAARIEDAAAKAKAGIIAEARDGQTDAKANGYTFNPYGYGEEWQVVADLPGYLSLSNAFHSYTGGAHGMYGMQGLVWDKAGKRAVKPEDLFRSPGHIGSAIGGALCRALEGERSKKGIGPDDAPDPVFPACPALDEATILVGSSNGRTFDRITVWYGPYVAGSYAEGAYELDFPMTAAMLGAVKPAYRAAFSANE